ncbi:ASCH domain-containing protein [Sinorhizobium meliloti]|uniref:ASCH domain-containing protein n=1 Tax=Rhizobium meliloti TaxID=382 RepID=UPI0020940D22|nr:ASCH domain-containing protein [Sinorhizobium meliloti]MCO6425420.1 ASCH domain-containing protein [Sinorhizobium meliloti]
MILSTLDLPLLALSIRQPWAHACAAGWKDIENRKWRTAIRGPICIHASAFNKRNFEEDREDYLEVLHEHVGRPKPPTHEKVALEGLTFGAIIGTATIVDCVTRSGSPWFFGRFGFVLKDQRLLDTPIPVKGALGFFEWRPRVTNHAPAQQAAPAQKDLF